MIAFNSLSYLVFLTVVVLGYWRLDHRRQNLVLLAASWVFYGSWDVRFLGLFIFTTAVDYFTGILIDGSSDDRRRRMFLCVAVASNLAVLFVFKYANFFIASATQCFDSLGIAVPRLTLEVILPIGISFYTFQSISYVADVYRRQIPATRSFVSYALYLAFFPQLVAGPIERAAHLLREIEGPRSFRPRQFWNGIDLILWGLVKKAVVADNFAYYVNRIFALQNASTLLMVVGTLGFGAQILADFSAYSDIARGSAKLLGFEVMKNFRRPYLAVNIVDFWRRWHISLSNWVRDYIYIPLGGSRRGRGRMVVNLLVTWFLCGLWHGAGWNYILWGVYHGVLIISYQFAGQRVGRALPRWASISITFAFSQLGWMLFRTPSLGYLERAFSAPALARSAADLPVASAIGAVFLFFLLPYVVRAVWMRARAGAHFGGPERWIARGLAYSYAGLLIFIFGRFGGGDFIYFQF